MAFDSPPAFMDGTTLDAEVIRRSIGTLLSPAGGIVTPGDLAVAQQTVPNMSVQIGVGQVWVPGTSTATQGAYYSRNGAAITQAINAASASNPRVDIVGVQVQDIAYAGAAKQIAPFYAAGTPTAGATLANLAGIGAVPASSLVLAYVLVPTNATSIVTADIENVAPQATTYASRGAVNIAGPETRTNVAYGTMPTPDQVSGIVLPTNGLIAVSYLATWQDSVGGAASAAIFLNGTQLKVAGTTGPVPQEVAGPSPGATNFLLLTTALGLTGGYGSGTTGYSGDATTGQVVGFWLGTGGPCYIFAAAGTYTVSVQFKASSGSVTASNRKLWVEAVPFS